MAKSSSFCLVEPHQLADVVRNHIDNVLILDSRSFLEYNVSHVINAVNVGCAKLMKRRLQQDKLSIQDFLSQSCHWDVETSMDIVVYDQNTEDPSYLPPDSFMSVFLHKLLPVYNSVNVLKGGFLAFQGCFPHMCETEKAKFTPLTSLSQPCLPISDHGPTRILPFLYLGSQHDALNKEVLLNHNITYELNVSTNCPKPDFIQDAHFMRISVIDNYSEKLLPHFTQAFQFLDKVRESGGCALVHCLAGISRSATVAIAYVMKHLKMTSDEAYRYVKSKRANISPNFNFLGQLLEYEGQLEKEKILCPSSNKWQAATPDVTFSEHTLSPKFPSGPRSPSCLQNVPFKSCASDRSPHPRHKDMALSFKNEEIKAGDWNIKCAPVASLKELNFTPCQAASTTIRRCTSNFEARNTWLLSSNNSCNKSSSASVVPSMCKNDSPSSFGAIFDGLLGKSMGALSCGPWSSKECMNQNLSQVSFAPGEYNRSDSTSTSGLGSEGSDSFESWNDYHNSCERDVLMDEEYGTVPTDDDEYRTKIPSFDESLYTKYDDNDSPFLNDSGNKSPVSPSEEHYSRDFPSGSQDFVNRLSPHHCPVNVEQDKQHVPVSVTCDALKLGKCDGLYRARSCPGMFSEDCFGTPHSCERAATAAAPSEVRCRTKKAKRIENRNRYSCSSLDYMESAQSGLLKPAEVPSCKTNNPRSVSQVLYSIIQVS